MLDFISRAARNEKFAKWKLHTHSWISTHSDPETDAISLRHDHFWQIPFKILSS